MTATTAQQFRLPDVGEGLTEAEIVSWKVAVGDTVEVNQVIVEIETAKSVVELPCPFEGVVTELFAAVGDTIAVGAPLIAVGTGATDSAAAVAPAAAPVAAAAAVPEAAEPAPSVLVGYGPSESHGRRRRKPAGDHTAAAATPVPAAAPVLPEPVPVAEPANGWVLATPPVRKLARDKGVDLAAVTGTGNQGSITRDDLLRHLETGPAAIPAAAVAVAETTAVRSDAQADIRIPIKGVRKATAGAMVQSAFTAPHVTEFVTVDVTRSMKLVESLKQDKAFGTARVTFLLLVAKALLSAVRHHPEINSSWDATTNEIVQFGRVNLGIAAATPRGLLVPNVKDAGSKSLPELAAALTDLVSTAREGKTTPADMARGTITITNIGVFGIDSGTPILNPGEAAILCVGAVRRQPWEHKGKIKLRSVLQLSLSFDHRLVDGELGSKVLARVAAVLNDPRQQLLLD
ncbi:2-oxo acid dehydrogenase subunit E2 [Nakamurella sp. YIM 132087]|uniref:Dihydrolipoamide acetyltransferase component of pyruvate dehydrogenase complex n=1 Tax=Nakamurella alba TaxID=2665158 RepID=A0A7K1FN03_9ACTN|nr:dihydrolipoamide acetyltransferase family protein [Nakamurella alba]MTD14699.1 2-oxo acid dehydrogenase subunit E2 [Nakamurella alba]